HVLGGGLPVYGGIDGLTHLRAVEGSPSEMERVHDDPTGFRRDHLGIAAIQHVELADRRIGDDVHAARAKLSGAGGWILDHSEDQLLGGRGPAPVRWVRL